MTGPLHSTSKDRDQVPDSVLENDMPRNEGVQSMAQGNSYEPGPSFVEHDRPTDRLTELPAWLQTFAAQEIERTGNVDQKSEEQPAPERVPEPVEADATDSTLPDWLRDDPEPEPGDNSATDSYVFLTADFPDVVADDDTRPDSFISEDDLPDWLRAFSEESATSSPKPQQALRQTAPPSIATGGSAVVRVPPVENIWLSAYERQALGPGGTLFALLASNGSATVERSAEPHEQHDATSRKQPGKRTVGAKAADPLSASTSQDSAAAEAETQSNSLRLLLLTLLIVMLIVAISFWQFS